MAAAASILASPALAADCSMPAELVARICNVPALAKLDAELVAKERALLAVTPRPATWAGRTLAFRKWLAGATDFDGKPFDSAALSGHLTDQIHTLDLALEQARSIRKTASRADIGEKCLATWLSMNCTVPLAGILRDADGTLILWQLQSGASENGGQGMGALLWDASGKEPQLIGWTFDGVRAEAPRYDSERKLLWVSGRTDGTGDGNADLLYQRQGGKWVEINLENWQDALEKRLPKGIEVWKGVDYDLTSLSASTQLWKDGDANCCATGGRAGLDFEITGSTLRLKAISAQIGGPDQPWKDY